MKPGGRFINEWGGRPAAAKISGLILPGLAIDEGVALGGRAEDGRLSIWKNRYDPILALLKRPARGCGREKVGMVRL